MEKEDDDYAYWRHIWQITSGSYKNADKIEVEKTLKENQTAIIKGLVIFQDVKDESELQLPSEEITELLQRTAINLHVNKAIAWKVIKSYIINGYCGSIKSIQKLKYEMDIIPMLKNIWKFFSSERMFLIKTFKNVLEFMDDKDHPFSEVYKSFIQNSKSLIWKALTDQLDLLISEIQGNLVKNIEDDLIKLWIQRNLQETIEIIHCLIFFTNHESLNLKHFAEIIKLCKKHGFGAEPLYFRGYELADKLFLKNLTMSEVALLLCISNRFWTSKNNSWYHQDKELELEMRPLKYKPEHGAISFIWVMLHLTIPNKRALFESYYEKIGIWASHLGCNQYFADMISNEMFQNPKCLLGATVQDALFNMFCIGLENISYHEMIDFDTLLNVFSELLKVPHICDKFFDLSEIIGCVPVWSFAIELFPRNVDSFSRLAEAIILSDSKHTPEVIHLLEHLPYYTEEYEPEDTMHTRINQSENLDLVRLSAPKIASNYGYSIEIPANTQAIIKRESSYTLIHYSIETNYWTVFITEMNLILNTSDPIPDSIYFKMIHYMNVMIAVIKIDPNATRKTVLSDAVVLIFSMIDKLSQQPNIPTLKLFAVCLDICTELLHKCRPFIYTQMETYKLLPNLRRNDFDYKQIFNISFLEHGKLGTIMIRNEFPQQEELLISYLKFLRASFLMSNGSSIIELPGIVFVLKEIFPYLMIWFNKLNNKTGIFLDVLYEVIHFLFEIFRYPYENLKSDEHRRIRKIVYEFFVNELCARELLRILSLGNGEVQNLMEGQTNWRLGRGIRYISSIHKIMAILMQLLTQRKLVLGYDVLTPLEIMIYNENSHTIQAIASFVHHPFNECIPNLAVRLLKRLTTELQMSMLAALDLEPDQVRMMFIQRLRDRFESEEMKLAIIEFITACIPKQSGMTEAFFKVTERNKFIFSMPATPTKDSNTSSSGTGFNEGIGSFLVEYLYTFNNVDTPISNALLTRIMEVFHVLWMNQKEILITDIVKDEHFWPSLSSLLFNEIHLGDKTYSEIFNIIGKEIHKRRGVLDEPLSEVLKLMFSAENNFLNKWMKHCFFDKNFHELSMECDNEMPPEDCLILSLKDFIIISVHFLPKTYFSTELQTQLADDCRSALKKHVFNLIDNCVITFLTELYYYLIVSWGDLCFKNDKSFEDIVLISQKVAAVYVHLPNRFIDTMIAIMIHAIRALKEIATANLVLTECFIEAVGSIFSIEYDTFMNTFENKDVADCKLDIQSNGKFAMICEAYKTLLNIQNSASVETYNPYLCHTQLLHKLFECIKRFLCNKKCLVMTKIALDLLISYAQSGNSKDFFGSDIDFILWERMTTPNEYRYSKSLKIGKIIPWYVREWWILYKKMITLLTVLLQKHRYTILKKMLMFVSLHEDYIVEILLLERYTVHDDALDLIKMTLIFIRELLNYTPSWILDHETSLRNIIDAIKMNLNYSSSVIVRPSVLKYCNLSSAEDETFIPDTMPVDLLVEIMDKLTDIITLATYCILQFSPPLYRLLRDDTDYSTWPLQVGTSFGIPTFGDNDNCELTFGLLFCVSSIYVRILQQITLTRKNLHVTSPREILIARKSRFSTSKLDEITKDKTSTPKEGTSKGTDEKASSSDVDSPFSFTTKKTDNKNTGIIRIDYLNPMCIVSAVESFTTYANPVKSLPWYSKLNEEKAMRALETVITLIASQVSHILYHDTLLNRETRLIKRELSSELQSFHEFVKRRLVDTHRPSSDRSNLIRKKYGKIEHETNSKASQESLTRGLPSKRTLDMSGGSSARLSSEERQSASISTNSGLFEVKLSNDDYLHFLSVWFSYFLHYE